MGVSLFSTGAVVCPEISRFGESDGTGLVYAVHTVSVAAINPA